MVITNDSQSILRQIRLVREKMHRHRNSVIRITRWTRAARWWVPNDGAQALETSTLSQYLKETTTIWTPVTSPVQYEK